MLASLISLSIPAPLSSLEQPLEVPQRKGCWALWADSLKPHCQTDQQAGQSHTEWHTDRETGHEGRRQTSGKKEDTSKGTTGRKHNVNIWS